MSEATGAPWSAARNVLCVRLDTLGDVLMTTPAIRALRESGPPGRRISLLTSPAGEAAARLVPEIDDVIIYEAPWLKASGLQRADETRAMADSLRTRAYDAAVVFTVFSQNPLPSALLCHLADIPLRLAHCRENPYQLLSDWVPEPEPERLVRHEVRRQLDLVATVGATTTDERLSLAVPEEARHRVAGLLAELHLDLARPWVVIHPGASAPSRRYPEAQFAAAAAGLARDLGCQLVFSGGPDERELVEAVRSEARVTSLSTVGLLDLAGLAALLERAPLLVANNTGPVHVAAAVGTPVVDLYALTNPQHAPWGVPSRVLSHDVPCRYCYKSVCPMGHHDCLRLVDPAAVVDAAADLLGLSVRRRLALGPPMAFGAAPPSPPSASSSPSPSPRPSSSSRPVLPPDLPAELAAQARPRRAAASGAPAARSRPARPFGTDATTRGRDSAGSTAAAGAARAVDPSGAMGFEPEVAPLSFMGSTPANVFPPADAPSRPLFLPPESGRPALARRPRLRARRMT